MSHAVDTNFTAVRVRRDVLGRSTIGALVTNRSASIRAPGANHTFGVDGVFPFYEAVRIDTHLARTRTPGLSGNDLSHRGAYPVATTTVVVTRTATAILITWHAGAIGKV